ncbi:MAG TPA: ribosome-associated translation inhibitor RaiA [Salinarimonas sp.]|jgi:ribosomal subunit interface protein|nr:ribosome-associated translation inhibitor RaiA [Salinarimonas sp.]
MSEENITVGSANVSLGTAFPDSAREQIRQVAEKYFGDLTTASVHVTKEGTSFRCSVNIRMGGLRIMSGEAQAREVPLAFRGALDKVEKQLRRTKRELREDKPRPPETAP